MRRAPSLLALVSSAAAVALSPAPLVAAPGQAPDPAPAAPPRALALPFVRNDGQTDRAVAFHARLRGGVLFVTRAGDLVYALDGGPGDGRATFVERPALGAAPRLRGERRADVDVSFFRGADPRRWRSGVPTFEAVSFGEVAPGVALTLEARGGVVEKVFRLAPGADPRRIWIEVKGARGLAPDPEGRLAVDTARGIVRFSRPVAYQPGEGGRREVPVAYRAGRGGYGFTVGAYDRALPLVIDPLLSTFLGGAGDEHGRALAIHSPRDGDPLVYVAGTTTSSLTDFPLALRIGGAPGTGDGGGKDAFLARLDYDLAHATVAILGGPGDDEAWDVAVHPGTGKVYLVGYSSGGFPMLAGGDGRGGGRDGFVVRLSGALTSLEATRYLGGAAADAAAAVVVEPRADEAGDLVYVAGMARSSDLPATAGAAQPAKSGGTTLADGFAAVLDADLHLVRATYLGGISSDSAYAVAVGADHRVFVAGVTSYDYSREPYGTFGCFPWIPAEPNSFGGEEDAFVVRLADRLVDDEPPVARYVGGRRMDWGLALATHAATGDVFLAGMTTCAVAEHTNDAAFPLPPAPYVPGQAVCAGHQEGYVVRLDPDDLALVGATFLGGVDFDHAYAVVASGAGVHVLGKTDSQDLPATAGAADPVADRRYGEAFLASVSDDLRTIRQVTYLGGSSQDESLGRGLAILRDPHDGAWQAFAAGETTSDDLPGIPDVPGLVAQRVRGGSLDAFVTRLPASLLAPPSEPDVDVEPAAVDFGNTPVGATINRVVELRNLGRAPLALNRDAALTGDPAFGVHATGTCASLAPTVPGPGSCTLHVSFAPPALGRYDGALHLHSNDPDEPMVSIPLSGVSEPDIELLPAEPGEEPGFTFPDVALGTSFDVAFAIRNAGTAPLTVSGVTHTGSGATPSSVFVLRFGAAPLCPEPSAASPLVLAPGQSCGVVVKFLPQALATCGGVARVSSDDPDEDPAWLRFSGVCVSASLAPDLVGEASLDFGEVTVGEARTLATLVSNRGEGAALQVWGWSLSDPARFSVNPLGGSRPCATQTAGVPPLVTAGDEGSYCTAEVTFAPTAAAAAVSETLVIQSNDPSEPEHTVRLVGRAVAGEPPPPVPPPGGGGGGGGLCATGGAGAAGAWLAVAGVLLGWAPWRHGRRRGEPTLTLREDDARRGSR